MFIAISKVVWVARLRGRPLLTLMDNESARFGLIAGYSPVVASAELITASAMLDARLSLHQWCARVPSPSKVADGPSRLDFAEVLALGGEQHNLANIRWDVLAAQLSSGGGVGLRVANRDQGIVSAVRRALRLP